jgi:4-amino-4-deoxy-L-arabinose transferase-like glycosyltransferase
VPAALGLNRGLVASVTIAAVLLIFFYLGQYRTFGKHEGYVVVTAREMIESGDWIVPRFAGVPRLAKPPLAYWVIAASASLCGELNEWSARLPAALSSLGLAALIGIWGARWHGRVAGLGAAAVAISSLLVQTYARRAEVDMLLCLITTGAMFLAAEQPFEERGIRAFARWTGIYALLAVAWMAKFQYSPVMVLAPVFVHAFLQRRWRTGLDALNPVGLAMMAAAMFIWKGIVVARVPNAEAVWMKETVGRVSGSLGAEPAWFYFLDIMIVLLPWSPLLLLAAPASWMAAWRGLQHGLGEAWKGRSAASLPETWVRSAATDDCRQRFLWTWFLVQFTILSSMSAKHQHYLAAALPMMALLAGRAIDRVARYLLSGEFEFGRVASRIGLGIVLVLSTGSAVVLGRRFPELMTSAVVLGLLMAVGGCVTVLLTSRRQYVAAVHSLIAAFVVCSMVATAKFVPADDYRRPAAEFAREMRSRAGGDALLVSYAFGPDPLVYYLGSPARRVDKREELDELLHEHRTLRVVALAKRRDELAALGDIHVLGESVVDPTMRRAARLIDVELSEREPTLPAQPKVRYANEPERTERQ